MSKRMNCPQCGKKITSKELSKGTCDYCGEKLRKYTKYDPEERAGVGARGFITAERDYIGIVLDNPGDVIEMARVLRLRVTKEHVGKYPFLATDMKKVNIKILAWEK